MRNEGFTGEQQRILDGIYAYRDDGEITDGDMEIAKSMFDRPEKLKLLRKIFGVLTSGERGITFRSPQALVQADVKDLQGYAIETAVNHLADEKVRQSLVQFYLRLKASFTEDQKAAFEEENREQAELAEKEELARAELDRQSKTVGPNI